MRNTLSMVVAVGSAEAGAWDAYVKAHPNSVSYHGYGWRHVFARSFGHGSHYLAAMDDSGKWRGVLPLLHMHSRLFGRFLVSLPFVNYGGVLSDDETVAAALLQEAEALRRKTGATHVELRHVGHQLENLPTKYHKVTMILNLPDSDEKLWKSFDPKLRNQIRKAEKSGLQFTRGHIDLLDDFYEVFARNMRDLGTPVYSKNFFRNVLETFPSTTEVFAVKRENKIVAAGIGYWFRDRMEIPWASSIRDFKSLCPNHMMYWEAIRVAIGLGMRDFDFGRSTPNEGTYNFKKQWGALPVPLHWQYLMDEQKPLPSLSPDNPKYRLAIRIWQRLPVWITKLVGPPIVRNIP